MKTARLLALVLCLAVTLLAQAAPPALVVVPRHRRPAPGAGRHIPRPLRCGRLRAVPGRRRLVRQRAPRARRDPDRAGARDDPLGTYPYRHGIIANGWVDRHTVEPVTGDPAHTYVGEETKKLDGTSPANLRVTTVGDGLKYANNGQSKVIAMSGKDRGAILLAGKRGTAYMYMDKGGIVIVLNIETPPLDLAMLREKKE